MKKSHALILCAALGLILLTGCQPDRLYYWGDYSQTYYDYVKEPNEENLLVHLVCLQAIIDQSKVKNKQVPPGVHGEYGYYLMRMGKTKDALFHFEQEKQVYPESHIFMDRLIAAANSADSDETNEAEQAAEVESPQDDSPAVLDEATPVEEAEQTSAIDAPEAQTATN